VERYPFLSERWTAEVKRLHDEIAKDFEPSSRSVRMNLVLTEAPFGEDGCIDAHLDTSAGGFVLEPGHLDDPDLTVTVDYSSAKAILVEGNAQAGMQAFMAGRITVEGDMTLLLALQTTPVDPVHQQLALRIREITD
jgi:putative sterol carrier protein